MADGTTIVRRNRPGTKAKVKFNIKFKNKIHIFWQLTYVTRREELN